MDRVGVSRPNTEEIHVFIIWEKAYAQRERILEDLRARFRIAAVREITWSAEIFSENLTRFYGTKLPDNSFKQAHCGTGPFTVVVIADESPALAARNTSKGRADVSANVFDAKATYRQWTGGGHRIHGTNTPTESAHDLALLFGESPAHFQDVRWGGQVEQLDRNLTGAGGWNSLTELFETLNASCDYVVLRNFEALPEQLPEAAHPDIDFQVADRRDFSFIANARRIRADPARACVEVSVAGQSVPCDVRSVGDGYYDQRWQRGILRRRVTHGGVFVPAPQDHFPSLLYHSLIHKPTFSEEARRSLGELATKAGVSVERMGTRADAMAWLCGFMSRMRYDFTAPEDHSVGFNLEGVPRIRNHLRSAVQRQARSWAKELQHELARRILQRGS